MMCLYLALAFSLTSFCLWACSAGLVVISIMVFMGTVMFDACHVCRLVLAADVLLSMLARDVLKSESCEASLSFPCVRLRCLVP